MGELLEILTLFRLLTKCDFLMKGLVGEGITGFYELFWKMCDVVDDFKSQEG